MTTVDNVIVIESEESDNSIIEVEVPKKPSPLLISLEDEEMVLNIKERNDQCILAKDFIEKDRGLILMAEGSTSLSSPNHWTLDMIKYYDEDWGNEEDFVVEKLQEKMDKHPSLWDVSGHKRLLLRGNFGRSHKCWNCGQRGHHISLCPDPPHVVKCHMCGNEGHAEYFCPNSICLNCGSDSREYVTACYKCRNEMNEVCSRCQLLGHNFINCPDHWRLFHMTTGSTTVKVPNRNLHKPDKDLWCCNCGRQGHNQTWCKKKKDCGGFFDSFPFVISYERALNYSQPNNKKQYDMSHWKNKGNNKRHYKTEQVLRINPQNKTIRRDKIEMNKFKKIRKNRKNKNRNKNKNKKIRQRFLDGMPI